jgi:hypothetical protein
VVRCADTLRCAGNRASATGAIDPTVFFGQDTNALDRMSGEFARIVSAILEAF